ncbi:MAG: DsbA family protein [Gammaproteobacteria bacterium]|nr:DsbA family protein [Gammaproteobacteria bacterium]MBU1555790.1 DsbA family protein [Gammaproteobacteria bacterium]MBU2069684.1 DsbA family protein [Gammaproteobacteria bacterium]MBU2184549.1 DsbA family protein [Gammaproteobacteria bacterium]MBU2205231.1 DsbA family protein [Gammaproteobacteria bacterium]
MKFLLPGLLLALLAGCTGDKQQQAEIAQLRAELEQVKSLQTTIARRVGMGELVRPDAIEFHEGEKVGSEDAALVIVEFTDLHCPFCARFHNEVYPQLKEQFIDTGKVLFVGRELPLLSIHQQAGFAAVALRCASAQQQYSAAKDSLFNSSKGFTAEYMEQLPVALGVDAEQFNTCLQDAAVHQTVSKSISYAQELGFKSTPTFIVGRKQGNTVVDYTVLTGAKDLAAFTSVFDSLTQ